MEQLEPDNFLVDFSTEAFCRKHGTTLVTKTGTLDGYNGGVCTFWKLACGCTLIDEDGDIESAK